MIGIKEITRGRFGNRILQYNNMCQVSKEFDVGNYCVTWEGHKWFKDLITNNINNQEPIKLLRWNHFLGDSYKDLVMNNNCSIDGTVIHNFFYKLTHTNPRNFLQIKDEYKPKFKDNTINVGVHFRGGDKLRVSNGREIHSIKYYIDGIKIILDDDSVDTIHVCTDDVNFKPYVEFINYVKKNITDVELKLGPSTNRNDEHIYDFALLSECDYLLSNSSTYVVCAGFLGKENKKIIHSKDWINKSLVGDKYVKWGNYTEEYPKTYWTEFDNFWIDVNNGNNDYYKVWKII